MRDFNYKFNFVELYLGCAYLTTPVNYIFHTASDSQMFVNEKLARVWDEAVCFCVMHQRLPGRTNARTQEFKLKAF
jgi:hypothetical protein